MASAYTGRSRPPAHPAYRGEAWSAPQSGEGQLLPLMSPGLLHFNFFNYNQEGPLIQERLMPQGQWPCNRSALGPAPSSSPDTSSTILGDCSFLPYLTNSCSTASPAASPLTSAKESSRNMTHLLNSCLSSLKPSQRSSPSYFR